MQTVGRYRLQGELGRGANGVVYRAWDPERSEDVAVKVLTELDGKKRKRFATEVRTLARLRHPHLVTILAYGEHQGHPYLVMEFVRGGSLQAELEQRGTLSPGRAVELSHRLAQAVAYAHSCAVIHRDIKPDNVLLTLAGEPKLTDFGLARDMEATHERLTRTRASMGTPGYWAPEQAAGKTEQIGEQTDVYGLGATLYAMLTGGPPVQGSSYLELVQRTVNEPPIPPRRLAPEVWPNLEAVCLKALAKAPEDRFSGATSLARALHASLRAPTSGGLRVPRRALMAAGGVAVVAAAVGAVWVLASRPSSPEVAEVAAPSVSPLVAQGEKALEAEDFEALRAIADQLLAQEPDSAHGRLWRGIVRRGDGDAEGARGDLSAAYAHPDTTHRAALELARLHLEQGDYPAAEDWARRARELDAEGGAPDWVLAQALLGQEKTEQALAALAGPSEREGPLQLPSLGLTAEVLIGLGRLDEAVDTLKRAIEVGDEAHPHRRLAQIYAQARRIEEAEEAFARALERTTEPEVVLNDRARFRLAILNAEGALADAQRAVDLDPQHPLPRVTLGRVLFLTNQSAKALEVLQSALKLDPACTPALLALAQVLLDALDCEGALRALDRLIELDETAADAFYLRGVAFSELEDLQAAMENFKRAIELEGGRSALTFARVATLLREHGQLMDALEVYDQALEVDPQCAPARYGRGLCLQFVRGRRQEAISELQRGLAAPEDADGTMQRHWLEYLQQLPPEVAPHPPGAWLEQAHALYAREELRGAALCFSHALELGAGGQRGAALFGLAKCLYRMGQALPAEQAYTRALWAGAGVEALLERGLVRGERGDRGGAVRDFGLILQRDPTHGDALIARGTTLARMGEEARRANDTAAFEQLLNGAANDFAAFVQAVPEEPRGWINLALAAFQLEDHQIAVEAATRGLGLTPDDPQLLELRGAARIVLEDYAGARADLDRALELGLDQPDTRFKRMLVAQRQGDHATAVADARALLARTPGDVAVQVCLAESLGALGERAEALRLYDDSLQRMDPASPSREEVQRARDALAAGAREDQ